MPRFIIEEHSKGGFTSIENGGLVHRGCHPKSAKEVVNFSAHWKRKAAAGLEMTPSVEEADAIDKLEKLGLSRDQAASAIAALMHTPEVMKMPNMKASASVEMGSAKDNGRYDIWPKKSLEVFDACFELVREVAPSAQPNYEPKSYIGVALKGRSNTCVRFRPRREWLRISALIKSRDTWLNKLEKSGLEVSRKPGDRARFRLGISDVSAHRALLRDFFAAAYGDQG